MKRTKRVTNKKVKVYQKSGLRRKQTLLDRGMHPQEIKRLVDAGLLVHVDRGIYINPNTPITESHDLAVIAARVPNAVICLISALRFHGMTTQIPRQIWIAIENRAAAPRLKTRAVRIIRLTGPYLYAGIEKHTLEGVPAKIYSPAKTVVDCFKFRNKIGLDIALEALKEYRRQKKGTIDEVWRYARMGRVANVMQPYLEASS